MQRTANTTHRYRAHGLSAEQLIADYHRAHPGRLEAQLATHVPARVPVDVEPLTAPFPRILLQAFAPVPAVVVP